MATVVGFLIAGTLTFGAGTIPEDGVYTNDVLLNTLQSTKFAVGKDGNLEIYSNGSVGYLLSDLQKDHSLSGIQNALSQQNKHPGYVVLTGALAGQGRYSDGVTELQNLGKVANGFIKNEDIAKILSILERTNTYKEGTTSGETNTTIGDKTSSPVVLGLIGGDMIVGTGGIEATTNPDKPEGIFIDIIVSSSKEEESININKEGNSTVTINNGNVFGGTVGSAALSLGNISAKGEKIITKTLPFLGEKTIKLTGDLKLNGNTTATIKGNTNLNINNGANGAGLTAGGVAAAIGGTAVTNVTGDTNIKVNSVVNAGELAGLTVGLFGGGMAVSTLGGSASANTTGTTNVEISDGLSVGVVGGGLAVATDASQYLKDGTLDGEIKDGNFVVDKDGIPPITISGLKDGGTSKVTSGDININLKGTTAAAGVLGNGIAVSHQNAPQGKAPTETDKISTSTIEAGNITVNIGLDKKINGDYIGNNGVITEVKELLTHLKNVVTPNQGTDVNKLIGSMKDTVNVLKDGGIAVGVAGNGIAVSADKGISTVKAANTTTNLTGGYIVGALGNGIAMNNGWAKSTAEVAEKSVVNIDGNDTEVIGVSGNGMAVYYGAGNYNGSLDFDGMALAQVKDSEINIKNGSADGVFGGGIAIDDSELNIKNAVAETTGTSTINVTGGYVKDFGYEHLGGVISGGTIGGQDYASYYKEVQALGDGVAIVAGGVAAGNMAEAHVENSVVNISGGKVEGDILAGGLATRGATSHVENSTINITGGEILGSVYGTGKATEAGEGKLTEAGTATVGKSTLNIDGYKGSLEKIAGFNEINIGMDKAKSAEIDKYNTQLTITDGIDVGSGKLTNEGAIIFANDKENSTLITVGGKGTVLNTGIIVVDAGDKVAKVEKGGDVKNTGKIQINGEVEKDFVIADLFAGDYTNLGMIVDENDNAILLDEEKIVSGNATAQEIMDTLKEERIVLGNIELGAEQGKEAKIDSKTLNVVGTVTNAVDFEIANGELNFDNKGHIEIKDKEMTLSNVQVNGSEDTDIKFTSADSKLVLNNTTVAKGGIGENTTNGVVEFTGTENSFNGKIAAKEINIGEKNAVAFGEDAVGTGTITLNGDAKIAVGKENTNGVYTQNFFHNSNGNLEVQGTGNIVIGTKNFEGEKVTVDFGNNEFAETLINKLDTTSVYMIKDGEDLKDGKLDLVYNTKLYEDNSVLNNINNAAHVVNDKFSDDPEVRKVEIDKHYSSNIYSETVKAAYDNVKMNEEAVESLARKSETGKWTAEGKALYSKNEYDRKGIVGDYSSEVESTGLMAAFGYGVNETTTAGIAFSGVKQDVDTATGSADADLFYLGLYGNKVVGNYDFTAGLGYQFGEYDADNNILAGTGDKYDSQTVSGYVQGRYTADLGDGLSVQPKVKLGYTYVKQDDAKDSYFGVEDAEISTFDAEAGFDVVKSVQLEKSKVDVKFGASYIRTMGDTDEEFTGRFYGAKASEGFNVLGAELAENVVKFNLGAEVTNENGFFYNGGLTYEFGSNNTEAYGVNVGVGYKF